MGLLVLSIILRTVADVSLKQAVCSIDLISVEHLRHNLCRLIRNPFLWIGSTLGILNMFVWGYSLKTFDLSYAYPFLSISYISIIVCGYFLFGEKIDRYKFLGIVLICVGASLLFI